MANLSALTVLASLFVQDPAGLATPSGTLDWAAAYDNHRDADSNQLAIIHASIDTLAADLTPAAQTAILRVAGVGLDRSLANLALVQLRDKAHWTLFRHRDELDWSCITRTALGVRNLGDLVSDHEAEHAKTDEDRLVHPGHRVAALRLLGHGKRPAFRTTIESCLTARDARVRLAAAEALGQLRHKRSIQVTARALALERHPVVAQVLIRTAERILKKNEQHIHPDRIRRCSRAALRTLGKAGWRTDLAIVRFIRSYPCMEAIPAMIARLEPPQEQRDKLRQVVNQNASPYLRHEAVLSLRRLTGAILPGESQANWLAFWQAEKSNIKLPKFGRDRGYIPKTGSGFFGIPVEGKELCFVINTSGSMEANCDYRTSSSRRRRTKKSRLKVAAEQTIEAVHAMNAASYYHLITFASEATLWNAQPVPPIPKSFRSLTGVLSRLRPKGGTNLYEALDLALDAEGQVYGQLTNNEIDAVFVLSDGEPQGSERILEMVAAVNQYQKIRIHTVFCGKSTKGAKFLQELAKLTGGAFVQVH